MHIFSCLLYFLVSISYGKEEVHIDLNSGEVTGSSEFVEIIESPRKGLGWTRTSLYRHKKGKLCNLQGLVKMGLELPYTSVKLRLKYEKPRFWTFHLAQDIVATAFGEAKSNNSLLFKPQLHVWNRQVGISGSSKHVVNSTNLSTSNESVVILELGNKAVRIHEGEKKESPKSGLKFSFPSRESRSFYVGLNRIIGESNRYGYGLCSVSITLKRARGKRAQCSGSQFELCHKNAMCKHSRRKFKCKCKDGFKGNGNICRDVNECKRENGGCVHNCENVEGSFRCSCFHGFQLHSSGRDCEDLDECARNNHSTSLLCSQVCINTLGSFRCQCRAGFFLASDGRSCVKAEGERRCSELRCSHACDESLGSCSCPAGYRLGADMRNCFPSCQVGNGGCHHLCFENELGQPACGCQPKYLLGSDNRTCHGTCGLRNGNCKGSLCVDTHTGTRCKCPRGFRLSKHDSTSCEDVNECSRNNGRCEFQCRNFRGGYECICPPGFILHRNRKTCSDVNECSYNDTCEGSCENTPGSFRCSCRPGFQLYASTKCGDLDECANNNGDCQHGCINTPGSYHCTCPEGMDLHPNSRDCIVLERSCSRVRAAAGVDLSPTSPTVVRCLRNEVMALRPGINYLFSCRSTRCSERYKMEFRVPTETCLWTVRQLNPSRDADDNCSTRLQLCLFRISCELDPASGRNMIVLSASLSTQFHTNNSESPSGGCDAGSYFNVSVGYCLPCPPGSYQRNGNTFFCFLCPVTSPDKHGPVGATRIEQCPGQCLAGSYSGSGTVPCFQCPLGFYQPNKGRTQCSSCGRNIPTSFQGSTSYSDCIFPDFCERGHYFNASISVCQICPKGSYQPVPGQNFCHKCPADLSTDLEGSTDLADCKEMRCNQWKEKRSGMIQSPNFPLPYPANVTCEWTIKSGGRRRGILLLIPRLNIANDHCADYLVIRKSKSPFSLVTYEVCNSVSHPLIFISRTRKLWIQFQSNGENSGTGFSLRYVTFKESMRPLIEDMVNDRDLFSSPNHKVILENREFLDALVDVVSQPNNYQKYMHLHRFFPESFILQMWPKIHRFFDLPDLEQANGK